MSPLRWDVLLVGLVLAVPVLGLGLRGDFTTEEMVTRLPWCLVAGWAVVALLRFVTAPRTTNAGGGSTDPRAGGEPVEHPAADSEGSPAA